MKISRHGLLPLMLSSFGLFGCSDDAPPRPNIVFILMDDAGYGEYIAALEDLFDKYSDNGLLVMPNILNSYMNTGEL